MWRKTCTCGRARSASSPGALDVVLLAESVLSGMEGALQHHYLSSERLQWRSFGTAVIPAPAVAAASYASDYRHPVPHPRCRR
jgi:hypothetical protein